MFDWEAPMCRTLPLLALALVLFVPAGQARLADEAKSFIDKDLSGWEGFDRGAMAPPPYVALWNAPYSKVRAHPEFRKLLAETGVVAYWRQTGKWGDGCAPVGADDFQCR